MWRMDHGGGRRVGAEHRTVRVESLRIDVGHALSPVEINIVILCCE